MESPPSLGLRSTNITPFQFRGSFLKTTVIVGMIRMMMMMLLNQAKWVLVFEL